MTKVMVVVSDKWPSILSRCFAKFASAYQFKHITSSPYFPQSNGEAERALGTIKGLLNKEKDPYLALLAYRSTPLHTGYSPSEMLMSRRLCLSPKASVNHKCLIAKKQRPHSEDQREIFLDKYSIQAESNCWHPTRKGTVYILLPHMWLYRLLSYWN